MKEHLISAYNTGYMDDQCNHINDAETYAESVIQEYGRKDWDDIFNDVESRLNVYMPNRAINYLKNIYHEPFQKNMNTANELAETIQRTLDTQDRILDHMESMIKKMDAMIEKINSMTNKEFNDGTQGFSKEK